jgi:ankyrin repeat protein
VRVKAKWLVCCLAPFLPVIILGGDRDLRLVEVIKNQDKDAVRVMLEQRADVNTSEADGATALHWAVDLDDLDTAEQLIRAGANVNAANELGITPLWLACANGNAGMIEKLLAAGANPNAVPATGESALMSAVRTSSVKALNSLLARGADVNAKENSRRQTALMWAVAARRPDAVRVLLEHGADVNARSRTVNELIYRQDPDPTSERYAKGQPRPTGEMIEKGGSTPFLFAARQGDLDSARLLLAAGANANDIAPDGTSALVMASYSGHGAFAAFLLDHGADPNAGGAGYTALHIAALMNDLDLVKTLLAHGANPNSRLTKGTPVGRFEGELVLPGSLAGATPFLVAAKFAEADIMRVLAAAGADPRLTTRDGNTALMAAADPDRRSVTLRGIPAARAESQKLEAVKAALDLDSDVNATNEAGDTALHIAAGKGSDRIVQLLVDKGARLDVKDKRGLTPLGLTEAPMVADNVRPRLRRTADLLRKLGAKQ